MDASTPVPVDVSGITSSVSAQAGTVISNAITMISSVAPYIVAIVGVGVVVSIGLRYIKKMRQG